MRQIKTLLAHLPWFNLKKYNEILKNFETPENFWNANSNELKILNWGEDKTLAFLNWKQKINPEKVYKKLEQENIKIIFFDDIEYPKNLIQIFDPPFALFTRGEIKNLIKIAVVGTRKITQYGRHAIYTLVPEIARQNLTIVSGLAYGVDKEAHTATLEAGGHTIAVLGGGIDNSTIAPRNHLNLALKILDNGGAVISEYPPEFEPTNYTFPLRNRIIAGLSEATIIIEAPKKSGSLITAQYALDSAREVFAVPQNITSLTAEGPNFLIKNGAHPLTSASDVLEILQIEQTQIKISSSSENEIEQKILESITESPLHPEIIAKQLNLPPEIILENITILELSGKVKNLGGLNYVRS